MLRKDVVLGLEEVQGGVVLGCPGALPKDFVRTWCAESWGENLWRYLAWSFCRQTRHHFRMEVQRYDSSGHGAFSWRLEDASGVLLEAAFVLYDDKRGEWSPLDIYRYQKELGRVSADAGEH